MRSRNKFVTTFIALMFVSSLAIGQQKTPPPQPDISTLLQDQSLIGTLEMLIGDPPPGSLKPPVYKFFLRQDNGDSIELNLNPSTLGNWAEITGWTGKRVKVNSIRPDQVLNSKMHDQALNVSAVTLLATQGKTALSKTRQTIQVVQSGSKPWVTVFCKFAESSNEPDNDLFYENMYSNSPGGLDHYWRENSYESINLNGSNVRFNWVVLPGTLESYMTETTEIDGESTPSPDLNLLFEDCTNAADNQVDFSNAGNSFFGINMMFNLRMGCCAWGGARFRTLDGVSKSWAITWLPPWAHRQSVTAHEMGHAFGLPHSNNWDDDDFPYDSPWDVMSMHDSTQSDQVPVYGALSPHTNTYHKYELGWISGDRLLEVDPDTTVSATLDALAQSITSHHRMALIKVSNNSFYTVEARKRTGSYEAGLPGDAIIIHEVIKGRKEPSWAVDSDIPPSDTGSNEGTMWRVGETFTNSTGDILVTVDSETSEGFKVTIENRSIKLSESETTALIELYNSTDGDNWTNNTNWLVGDPCSNFWFGVECGIGSVDRLELAENNLNGTIPVSLGNLVKLTTLDVNTNQLSGPIPGTLGNLTILSRLDLANNRLSGPIPITLGNLSVLAWMDLNNNGLSGPIPVTLGNLADLTWLNLSDNQLNGGIPVELGKLVKLYLLLLGGNQLTGGIPDELGDLADLTYLYLDNNQLSGPIPANLGNLAKLIVLLLYNNQLSGPIPSQFGTLLELQYLWLGTNQLTGTIPAELGNLTNLQELFLQDNRLNGPIPPELGKLMNLNRLWLASNQISGSIPATFENLTNLGSGIQMLNLGWNALYTDDAKMDAFLDARSESDWSATQTIAPSRFRVSSLAGDSVELAWNLIEYTGNNGGYRIWYGTTPGGPFLDGGITANKNITSHTISGLNTGQRYYFIAKSETESHINNRNVVISDPSDELSVIPTDTPFQINVGLNDAWYYPVTDGQGFFITVFPDIGYISLAWFTYDTVRPEDTVTANLGEPGHRWLNALGTYNGNQSVLNISFAAGGLFDTSTEITEVADGTIILTFSDCENGTIEYDIPSINQQGVVPIQRIVGDNIARCEELAGQAVVQQSSTQKTVSNHVRSSRNPVTEVDPAPLVEMNAGLNDAWFYPDTNGQGFFITVFPELAYVLLSWFTYDTVRPDESVTANLGEPGHRWLNALGAYSGNQAALDISFAAGGLFDTSTEVTEVSDGTILLTFTNCENGTVEYDIPSINQQGIVPIQRVVGDNVGLCETLNSD